MDTSTRLRGHGLQSEGKPFEDDGRGGTRRTELYGGPVGFGLCACGERSGVLDSDYARRVWHRGHKDEVRAATEGGSDA
jgi:hypothetical protein